jgi:hypothetical protein
MITSDQMAGISGTALVVPFGTRLSYVLFIYFTSAVAIVILAPVQDYFFLTGTN